MKRALNVLIPYNIAPFVYSHDCGDYYGVFISFSKYFEEKTGLKVNYISKPDDMSLSDAVTAYDCDIVLAIKVNYNYALTRDLIFSENVLQTGNSLFYRQGVSTTDLSQSREAVALTLGVKDLKENQILFPTLQDCIKAVEDGKADYGYGASLVVDYEIANANYKKLNTIPVSGSNDDYCVAFPKDGDIRLVSIVNKLIRAMDPSTVDSFITSNYYLDDISPLTTFVQQDPVLATGIISSVIVLFALFVIALIVNKRKQKQTEELKLAVQKADEANAARKSFLARMSHDMRTPLNGILGIAGLLRQKDLDSETKKEVEQMEFSGKYLLGLINDILDVSKMEMDKVDFHPTVCSREGVIDNIVNLITPNVRQKGIELRMHTKNLESQLFYVDVGRVEQLYMNILSNAVKFTPEGGTIDFMVENISSNSKIAIDQASIRDTGIGMSPEFLPHIFETFSQEHDDAKSKYKGTGLGMSIAKQIVDKMDGTIDVKSELGKGSEFIITLPIPIATEEQIEQELDHKTDNSSEIGLRGKRVLVCEDNQINGSITKTILEQKGAFVELAENGKIGLDKFLASKDKYYDAILMDIRMPEMDGFEATKNIRQSNHPQAKTIPIIAMTANAFDEDIQQSLETGMNEHLPKPIEAHRLIITLLKYVN